MNRLSAEVAIPGLARRLLRAALHPEDRIFALADLEEEFEERLDTEGRRSARAWYRSQVVRSILPALRGRLRPRRPSRPDAPAPPSRSPIGDLWMDIRHSTRSMVRSPLLMLVTVVSLGAGLGASSLAFALFTAVVFPSAAGLEEPETLVALYRTTPDGRLHGNQTWADHVTFPEAMPDLESTTAARLRNLAADGLGTRVTLLGEEVSLNFFDVTGMRPLLGRVFTAAGDGASGAIPREAVLGHSAWQRAFGGSEEVVGATVRLAGLPYTIVGVAPPGVRSRVIPFDADIWIPFGSSEPSGLVPGDASTRDSRLFTVLGRIEDGADLTRLQEQASSFAQRRVASDPELWTNESGQAQTITIVRESEARLAPRIRRAAMLIGLFFLGAAGLILALACANVAGLFLARSRRRRPEVAIRRSLGASRGRLVRMMLAEGLVPGLLAGMLGVWIAHMGTGMIRDLTLPIDIPLRLDATVDRPVLLVTFLLTVGASLAFSLFPAIDSARFDVRSALAGGGGTRRGGRDRSGRMKNGLVVVQCAATATLLLGASLFLRTLSVATTVDLGFDPSGIAVASRDISARESTVAEGVEFLRELRRGLTEEAGVGRVEMARSLELTLYQMGMGVSVARSDLDDVEDRRDAGRNSVTPGYLELLDIEILQGRGLLESDVEGAEGVAVVNQTFASRMWPDGEPIGRSFLAEAGGEIATWTVVGVARDGTYIDFDDGPTSYFWTSLYQDFTPRFAIAVEGVPSSADGLRVLREQIVLDEAEVQVVTPSILAEQVSIQFIHLRIASAVLGWGGLFGLFLAALGLYGLVAFTVNQRSREMALRLALGADRTSVVRALALEGVKLGLLGTTIGFLIVLPIARLLPGVLYGVGALDPLALGGTSALLVGVTLVATLVPARQILGVNPMSTLRSE